MRLWKATRLAVVILVVVFMGLPTNASFAAVDLGDVAIRKSGWRYNMTVMRVQAKTDPAKASLYQYYLKKNRITDEYVVAYAAAVAAKFGGSPAPSPPVTETPPDPVPEPVNETPDPEPTPEPDPTPDPDPQPNPPETAWKIYKGFRFENMPKFANCGISEDLYILYEAILFGSASKSVPNIAQLKNVVVPLLLKKNVSYVVIDIEHWDQIAEMDKLITVIRTIRDGVRAAGNNRMKFGFYMLVPVRNYLAPTTRAYKPGRWTTWLAQNEKLRRLAAEVDVTFPSLYTFYNDPPKWLEYAKANIAEARKYGKPTIPFLWPQYHLVNSSIGVSYIQRSFWQLQVETLHKLADGMVIWGSAASRTRKGWDSWNQNADWWAATKEFGSKNTNEPLTSGCQA